MNAGRGRRHPKVAHAGGIFPRRRRHDGAARIGPVTRARAQPDFLPMSDTARALSPEQAHAPASFGKSSFNPERAQCFGSRPAGASRASRAPRRLGAAAWRRFHGHAHFRVTAGCRTAPGRYQDGCRGGRSGGRARCPGHAGRRPAALAARQPIRDGAWPSGSVSRSASLPIGPAASADVIDVGQVCEPQARKARHAGRRPKSGHSRWNLRQRRGHGSAVHIRAVVRGYGRAYRAGWEHG